jgi:hypothetical protein
VPLAVVVVLLGFGLVGTGLAWVVRSTSTSQKIAQLKDDHAAHVRAKAAEADARKARVEAAQLPLKLASVKVATDKLVVELNTWSDRSTDEQLRTLHVLQELRSACLETVIAYNRAAAPLTDQERTPFPAQVDLSDLSYNCLVDASTT